MQDHLGSPIRLLGDNANDTPLAYDEFGVPLVGAGEKINQPFGFTGYQTDNITGMYFAQARYYAPNLGRFGAEDPNKDQLNWYGYCHNNPLAFFDPMGLEEGQLASGFPNEQQGKRSIWGKLLDGFQTVLDVAGLVPGFGEIADGVNALIYLGRGDYLNAGLSAAAMIPIGGQAATAGKLAKKAVKYGDEVAAAVGAVAKYGDAAADAARAARRNVSSATKTIDPRTGSEVGRFIVDPKGNTLIEPFGGSTIPAGRGGVDTHTLYPNGSNYQRLNPNGHGNNPVPHGHGHLQGSGLGMRGQGPSIDIHGNTVPRNSADAHWPIR